MAQRVADIKAKLDQALNQIEPRIIEVDHIVPKYTTIRGTEITVVGITPETSSYVSKNVSRKQIFEYSTPRRKSKIIGNLLGFGRIDLRDDLPLAEYQQMSKRLKEVRDEIIEKATKFAQRRLNKPEFENPLDDMENPDTVGGWLIVPGGVYKVYTCNQNDINQFVTYKDEIWTINETGETFDGKKLHALRYECKQCYRVTKFYRHILTFNYNNVLDIEYL